MELHDAQVNISKSRELIPINNGLTNFRTDFNIKSKGGEPFRAVIINQAALDNSENLEMKNAPKGVFSGRIIENSGSKDDWYIAIEADSDIEAFVSIDTTEVEEQKTREEYKKKEPKKKGRLSIWIIGLIIAAIVAIGYFVLRIFKKQKPQVKPEESAAPPAPVEIIPPVKKEEPPVAVAAIPAAEEPPKELNLDFSDLPEL